jgi:hypothetical protein
VFTTVKNVALDPDRPYESTSAWVVLAHHKDDGRLLWSASRNTRPYDSPLAAVASPDGRRLYVTGSAYDAFPVGATDARIITVAYDAATGSEIWSATWDGLPDGTDAGKEIGVSPDGKTVVVGGVTTTAARNLDFVTIGYDTQRGREKWVQTASGLRDNGSDSLDALVMDPRGSLVYVAGQSAGVAEFDLDFLTLAYDLRKGKLVWAQRFDGLGAQMPDRAKALAVSPDGSRVFVTGDSWGGRRDGRLQYDYATVAYDAAAGTRQWAMRYSGPLAGFNSAIGVVASNDRVVVTGQSRGASTDDVRDFGTVGYDAATGAEAWQVRYAPPRSDEIALALALSADGMTAFVTGSSSPNVQYTNLDETATVAYRLGDGSQAWASRLDIGAGNALSPKALAATDDGGVAVAAQTTRSADPLEGRSSDVYDAVIARY